MPKITQEIMRNLNPWISKIYLKLILVAPRNEQIVRFAISPACCWIRSVVSDHLKAVNPKFPNHQKWIDDVPTVTGFRQPPKKNLFPNSLDKNMVKPHQTNAMPHQKPALWIQERAFLSCHTAGSHTFRLTLKPSQKKMKSDTTKDFDNFDMHLRHVARGNYR